MKHGEFTLKSGATSSWFLDTKQTACRPDGIVAVTDALIEVFGDEFAAIDAIGGLTMGADPVAYGVAAVAATRGHRSAQLQRPQGGQAGRHHRADRRRAAAGRSGARHRGHHHPRHLADRGRRADRRVRRRAGVDDRDRRPRRHVRGDGGRGRASTTAPCSPPPTSASATAPDVRAASKVVHVSAAEHAGVEDVVRDRGRASAPVARPGRPGERTRLEPAGLGDADAVFGRDRAAALGDGLEHGVGDPFGVGGAEEVEMGVAFREMAERDQPRTVVGRGRSARRCDACRPMLRGEPPRRA